MRIGSVLQNSHVHLFNKMIGDELEQLNILSLREDTNTADTTKIKQRTEEWFKLRGQFILTGSTSSIFLGFKGLVETKY